MSQSEFEQDLELEAVAGDLEQYENTEHLRETWSGGLAELFSPLIAAEIARDLGVGSLRCKILTQLFYLGLANNGDANSGSWTHTLEQDIYRPLETGWARGAHLPEADSFYKKNAISAKYFKLGWFLRALRMGYFSGSDCPQGEAPAFAEIGLAEKYRSQELRPFKDLGFYLVSELERNLDYAGLQEKIENYPEKFFDWQAQQIEQYQALLNNRLFMKLLLGIIPFSRLNYYSSPERFLCPSTLQYKRAGLWHEEQGTLKSQLYHEAALDDEREVVNCRLPATQKRAAHKFLHKLGSVSQYLAKQPPMHLAKVLPAVEQWVLSEIPGALGQEYLNRLTVFYQEEKWDRISFEF